MAPQTRSASRPETPAFPLGSDGEYDGAAMRERKPRKNKKTLRKKDAAATVTLPSLSNSDASDDEAPWEGRLIRLAEVAEHRTAASAWTVVNGVVCDVTPFVRAHPGGDLILVAAGIDSTPLFESYHRVGLWGFAEKRFAIGRLHPDDMPLVAPLRTSANGFYATLKRRVEAELKGVTKRGNVALWLRAWTIMPLSLLFIYLAFTRNALYAIPWGIMAANTGICVMHDAAHGGLGNSFMSRAVREVTAAVTGASILVWITQHQVGHHSCTNEVGADPDINVHPTDDVRRFLPHQRWRKMHSWQVVYMPVLYCVLHLKWMFQDFTDFLGRDVHGFDVRSVRALDTALFFGMKALYAGSSVVWPLAAGVSPGRVVATWMLHSAFMGLNLAYVFQVSHISDRVEYHSAEDIRTSEWAELQVAASLDYAPGDRLVNALTGGLSHQSIHHLFPSLSHTVLPRLVPVMEATCKEFGVTYRTEPSYRAALVHHFNQLAKGGNADWGRLG